MVPILLSAATFISTFSGGLFALRNQKYLNRILGFAAGVLLGVVAFDLLPEIFALVNEKNLEPMRAMIAMVVGFLGFHVLEKSILVHHAHERQYGEHKHPHVGMASALALCGHSFLDGVGIGLGFQVSNTVGIAVAIAVIAHDFTDGLNTVTLMLTHRNQRRRSLQLLMLDAVAPVLGAVSTLFFSLPASILLLYLGFFAGFLLYIGASDILPEAHSKGSSRIVILLTILGTALTFVVTRFA